jgi:hypothetical protein
LDPELEYRMTARSNILSLMLLLPVGASAQSTLPPMSQVGLSNTAALLARVEEEVWTGWGSAPKQLLLVTDSLEYFLPNLGTPAPAWTRARVFDPGFLATFPAVGGIPTIVIGTPERTGLPQDRWVLTVLHEHFHQLQYSRPDYYSRLNALGLARGDTTGMWALNFSFPYDSVPIQAAVKRWAELLQAALAGPPRDRAAGAARAREAKRALDAMLAPDDRRYLDFQLWQEGVPRWIELAAARAGHHAGLIVRETLTWQEERLVQALTRIDLGMQRREVVYPLGAAVAELLEWEGSGWRRGYFERMFQLDGQEAGR